MGNRFSSHFGYVDLPSEILEVGIFDEFIEFDCMDGIYRVYRCDKLKVCKVYEKMVKND